MLTHIRPKTRLDRIQRLLMQSGTRKTTLQHLLRCRDLVLERRFALTAGAQGTDAECAYMLADLTEVEEEISSGVFRTARQRRSLGSARYVVAHWRLPDALAAELLELEILYRRC